MARLSYSGRILALALATGLPGTAISLALVWTGDYSLKLSWTVTLVAVTSWLVLALALRSQAVRPLQTVSNLLAALREGDYSMRGGAARAADDDYGLVVWEIDQLGDILREQRLGAMEVSALLRQVMAEIDVAVMAFDADRRLLLLNRAGERLLGAPARELAGKSAHALGLDECLEGDTPRTIEATFPGGRGRWAMSRNPIRQGGLRHQLVVLSNVQRALREEERQAWKRLVRVLSHEINNSLAPIKSIADSLQQRLSGDRDPAAFSEDLDRGLQVIRGRSESLGRFMQAYARLAKLPPPTLREVDVAAWIERVAALEPRLEVTIEPGPEMVIQGDEDQLDQLLINLVRNAADASMETGGAVRLTWRVKNDLLEVDVIDDGPGIADTANLFVPFFTTKPQGTGIGLALSRQIAEGHEGTIELRNRDQTRGCLARLSLPIRNTTR
jgi:nitrogen fixation/metabolism regulation signal transduction histidine kinase